MLRFVLFVSVLTCAACSDPAPLSPPPAGKANCALCEFLGDDKYTIAEGQGAHESPTPDSSADTEADSTQADSATEAEADSTSADSTAEADSTQADSDCPLCGFFGDEKYTIAEGQGAHESPDNSSLFADSNLESVVREVLDRPKGLLTPEDVNSLTRLRATNKNIRSLAGIEHSTALQWLDLMANRIVDVGPLANLTNLHTLLLGHDHVLVMRPSIRMIYQQQHQQWRRRNQIVDVGPLASLTNLHMLELAFNEISDVGPLASLTNLHTLFLTANQIVDVGPLASLTNLHMLELEANRIADVGPLASLTNLQKLYLAFNEISDVGPLVANLGLGDGDFVNLIDNPLSDQARNEQIPALKARGVDVHY